jgi:hypothetical protein
MTKTRLLWLLPIAFAPAACSDGNPVDLGHREAQLSDYAASWDGYAEAYTFRDGSSDRVRITLDANGVGTLEVGEAQLDPVPIDPEVGLPGFPELFRDGFRYPIHAATVDAGRIRFELYPRERYAPWCAIQTPFANTLYEMSFYGCVSVPPGKGYENTSGCFLYDPVPGESPGVIVATNPMPVDCARWNPCLNGTCTCTASACAFIPSPYENKVLVDGALESDGTSLVGTLLLNDGYYPPDDARLTIRLERQ